MTHALLENAAILLALCLLLSCCWRQWLGDAASGSWRAQVAAGVSFGAACVLAMAAPVALQPGLIFDARAVVLSLAGLFGGPLVAVVAATLASSYRLWLGGVGVWGGIASILLPTLIGLVYGHLYRQGRFTLGAWPLLGFGVVVQLGGLAAMLLLPRAVIAEVLTETALPLLLIMPLATLAIGLLLQDLLQRSRTAQALQLSEARLRALTSASPDLLMVLDEDGRYLEVVAPDERLLIEPSSRLLGRRIHDVLPQADAARVQQLIDRTLASGQTETIEYSQQLPTGRKVFEGHARRIETLVGGRRAVSFLAREITDRVNSELERRIAATAFESSQGMIITDADTRILRVNSAFTQITGYSSEEVLGRPTRLLRSGRHDDAFYQAMWQQLLAEGSWRGEIWNRRKNGDVFPERLTITAVPDANGHTTHYVGTLTDITDRKAAEDQIHHLAFYDALTGVPNRRLLFDRLHQALMASARSRKFGALMLFDLDAFKDTNDLHGHPVGDRLLCEVAGRLGRHLRSSDTIARVGGDEFALVLEGFRGSPEEAATRIERFGERILGWLDQPYQIDELSVRSTASMGVVIFDGSVTDVAELVRQADIALYEAKQAGRNTLRFFDPLMQEAVGARLQLEQELRRGLDQGEFILHLQPQVDAALGLIGAEALVRWQHPQRGLLSPGEFIPVAEHSGLIQRLDLQVLALACTQLARWASDPRTAHLSLAVNISAPLLYQANVVEHVAALLEQSGANPHLLKLELTESLLLNDVDAASARMRALKQHGIRFSLDDFGTGYSSLTYLHQLPLDQLKVDRSFVAALGEDSSLAIVRAICALAASLDIEVLAEGVETPEQRHLLLDNGCRRFQGYLFGRPMSEAAFAELNRAHHPQPAHLKLPA